MRKAVRQAAMADRLVLSKTDLSRFRKRSRRSQPACAKLNPGAAILDAGDGGA